VKFRLPTRVRLLCSLLAATLLALGSLAAARAACTSERFTVEGTPLTIALCLTSVQLDQATGSRIARVEATTSTPTHTASAQLALLLPLESTVAHAPASIELAPVGLIGTLHLTLHVAPPNVTIDSALLTPGAVILK